MHKKYRFLVTALALALLPTFNLAFCQDATSQPDKPAASGSNFAAQGDDDQAQLDQDIKLLRENVRSQKKLIVAANMQLTGAEAEKFWPVYEQYVGELVQINNTKYDLIKQYVQNSGTLTADQADSAVKRWLGVDESVMWGDYFFVEAVSTVLAEG